MLLHPWHSQPAKPSPQPAKPTVARSRTMSQKKRKFSLNPFLPRRWSSQSTRNQASKAPQDLAGEEEVQSQSQDCARSNKDKRNSVQRSGSAPHPLKDRISRQLSSTGSGHSGSYNDHGNECKLSVWTPEDWQDSSTADSQPKPRRNGSQSKRSTLPRVDPRNPGAFHRLEARQDKSGTWNRPYQRENILALQSGFADAQKRETSPDTTKPTDFVALERPNHLDLVAPPDPDNLRATANYSPRSGFQKNPSRFKSATIPARYGHKQRGGLIDPLEKAPFHMIRIPDADELDTNELQNPPDTGMESRKLYDKSSPEFDTTDAGFASGSTPLVLGSTTASSQQVSPTSSLPSPSPSDAVSSHDKTTPASPVDPNAIFSSETLSQTSSHSIPLTNELTASSVIVPAPVKHIAIPHWKRRDYPQERVATLQRSRITSTSLDGQNVEQQMVISHVVTNTGYENTRSTGSVHSEPEPSASTKQPILQQPMVPMIPAKRDQSSEDMVPMATSQQSGKANRIAYVYPFHPNDQYSKSPTSANSIVNTSAPTKSYSGPSGGNPVTPRIDARLPATPLVVTAETAVSVASPVTPYHIPVVQYIWSHESKTLPVTMSAEDPAQPAKTDKIPYSRQSVTPESVTTAPEAENTNKSHDYVRQTTIHTESLEEHSRNHGSRVATSIKEAVPEFDAVVGDDKLDHSYDFESAKFDHLRLDTTNYDDKTDHFIETEEAVENVKNRLREFELRLVSLNEEFDLNEAAGERVMKGLGAAGIEQPECTKLIRHIEESGRIVCLQLRLKLQIEKVEQILASLPNDATKDEKKPFMLRQSRLFCELEDAAMLRDAIRAKSKTILGMIRSNLNEPDAKAYFHFMRVREHLLVATGRLEDKIRLGEERIRSLEGAQ